MRTAGILVTVAILLGAIAAHAADEIYYTSPQQIEPNETQTLALRIKEPYACSGEVSARDLVCGFPIARVRLLVATSIPKSDKGKIPGNIKIRLIHQQDITLPPTASKQASKLCKRFQNLPQTTASKKVSIRAGSASFFEFDQFAKTSARGIWAIEATNKTSSPIVLNAWGVQIGYFFDATAPNCCNRCSNEKPHASWARIEANGFGLFFDYFDVPYYDPIGKTRILHQMSLLQKLTNMYLGEFGFFRQPNYPLDVFLTNQGGGQSRGGGRWLHIGFAGSDSVTAHEFGHRITRAYTGNRPAWFNEGIAVFFEHATDRQTNKMQQSAACSPRSLITPLYRGAYRHSAFLCWAFSTAEPSKLAIEPFHGAVAASAMLEDMAQNHIDAAHAVEDLTRMDLSHAYAAYAIQIATMDGYKHPAELAAIRPSQPNEDGTYTDFGFSGGEIRIRTNPGDTVCMIARCSTGTITMGTKELCKDQHGTTAICSPVVDDRIEVSEDSSIYAIDVGKGMDWQLAPIDSHRMKQDTHYIFCPESSNLRCKRNRVAYLPTDGKVFLFARARYGAMAISNTNDKPDASFGWGKPFSIDAGNTANSLIMMALDNPANSRAAIYAKGTPYLESVILARQDPKSFDKSFILRAGMVYPLGAAQYFFEIPKRATKATIKIDKYASQKEASGCNLFLSAALRINEQTWERLGIVSKNQELVVPLDNSWYGEPTLLAVSVTGSKAEDRCNKDAGIGFVLVVEFGGRNQRTDGGRK